MTTLNTVYLVSYSAGACATLSAIAIIHKKYNIPFDIKQLKIWAISLGGLLSGAYFLLRLNTVYCIIGAIVFSLVLLGILISKTYLRDTLLTVGVQLVSSFIFWPGFIVMVYYLSMNGAAIDDFNELNEDNS